MSDCDCSNTYYHECRPDDALTAGRHPKWQRVEPGYVVPAGQPYMVEYVSGRGPVKAMQRAELVQDHDMRVMNLPSTVSAWFIDSSWKPPLVLPTTPTWGIAVYRKAPGQAGKWVVEGSDLCRIKGGFWMGVPAGDVTDFIPLTDEQVARIEAAR